MIAFESQSLIHMLQQPSGSSDQDVHSRQSILFILQVLSTNDQPSRELMLVSNFPQNFENLNRLPLLPFRQLRNSCSREESERMEHTSSLVGLIIKAPNPSFGPHFFLNKFSKTGIKNARVFPLPVLAAPSTSLPFKARGKDFC